MHVMRDHPILEYLPHNSARPIQKEIPVIQATPRPPSVSRDCLLTVEHRVVCYWFLFLVWSQLVPVFGAFKIKDSDPFARWPFYQNNSICLGGVHSLVISRIFRKIQIGVLRINN